MTSGIYIARFLAILAALVVLYFTDSTITKFIVAFVVFIIPILLPIPRNPKPNG